MLNSCCRSFIGNIYISFFASIFLFLLHDAYFFCFVLHYSYQAYLKVLVCCSHFASGVRCCRLNASKWLNSPNVLVYMLCSPVGSRPIGNTGIHLGKGGRHLDGACSLSLRRSLVTSLWKRDLSTKGLLWSASFSGQGLVHKFLEQKRARERKGMPKEVAQCTPVFPSSYANCTLAGRHIEAWFSFLSFNKLLMSFWCMRDIQT